MNPLDRYLARATHALPRRDRRRVQEELRGGVLERAAEHQLAGHAPEPAMQLALHEFGDPVVMARGMQRVYTVPRVALPLTGLLGAAAITLTVLNLHAPLRPGEIPSQLAPGVGCSLSRSAADVGWWRAPVGWWQCRTHSVIDRGTFRRSDVLRALEAQGVRAEVNGYRMSLRFPGAAEAVQLSIPGRRDGEDVWWDKYDLVTQLAEQLDLSVKVSGTVNPSLTLGAVTIRLGTATQPVDAADLYMKGALRAVTPVLAAALPTGVPLDLSIIGATFDPPSGPGVLVGGDADQVYALIDNLGCLHQGSGACGSYALRVRTARAGRLAVHRDADGRLPAVAQTPEAFVAASRAGRPALLIWRLGTTDLRHLTLSPVSPVQE